MWRDGSLNCGENTTINPHKHKPEYHQVNMRKYQENMSKIYEKYKKKHGKICPVQSVSKKDKKYLEILNIKKVK